MTFIVRTSIDSLGRLHGVIQHVQGGRKECFDGVVQLGELITAMAAAGDDTRKGLACLENGGGAEKGKA